jgi:transposase
VLGDRGYDAEAIRQGLLAFHIVPWLAERNIEHGSGLGRWRWVVERTFAWLNQFRRLRVRYEKRAGGHSRGIPVLGVCFDLLALPASRLGGGLKLALPAMH